jgi:Tol biopolymer transport system component
MELRMQSRIGLFFFLLVAFVIAGCKDAPLSGNRVAQAQAAAARDQAMTRRIWSGPAVDDEGSPSPDGRFLTFADWRPGLCCNLAIRDLATGDIRIVVKGGAGGPGAVAAAPGAMALGSIVSPDGGQIAFVWFSDNTYSLRVVGVDGSSQRTLVQLSKESETAYLSPAAWSPDGASILVVLELRDTTKQIGLLSVADGALRVIKTLDWRAPAGMEFSPDGAYIAYDLPRHQDLPQRDVLVMATDASRERIIVDHPADDRLLGWGRDGRSVIFMSDRAGSPGAWAIDVADGKATGEPRLLKGDLWLVANSLGVDRAGRLYYSIQPTTANVFTATIDPATARVLVPPSPVSTGLERKLNPDWSPDGRSIAYVTQQTGFPASGPGNFRIVIRSFETGEVRELLPAMNVVQAIRWFPDGQSLLARGANNKGRYGLYRLDARSGAVVAAYHRPNDELFGPMIAPDGKSVYYRTFTGEKGEFSQIMALDLTLDQERELYRFRGNMGVASPSPDGRQLAFWIQEPDPSARVSIRVMPTSGGTPREVVRLPEGTSSPAGAPFVWTQSEHLLFVTQDTSSGARWISRVALAGGPLEKLDIAMTNLGGVRLHPDGRRLAFGGGEQSLEIWVMETTSPPR